MGRKRITQIFPWLLPLRQWQRKQCFYMNMKRDGNCYSREIAGDSLPYEVCVVQDPLYNTETGFDMIYQENKVFNLKLAAKVLNGVLIKPGEVFSFWNLVRYGDKEVPYREGLAVVNEKLTTVPGGGMCQMSNLLFALFLHSPLSVVERHGHRKKEFPVPGTCLEGTDATVSEGWLDLKVKNTGRETFQIAIEFDDEMIKGSLFSDTCQKQQYEIENGGIVFIRRGGRVMEEVDVIRKQIDVDTKSVLEQVVLYKNRCEIGYELQDSTVIKQEEIRS